MLARFEKVTVEATERALELVGGHFKTLLTLCLKDKYDVGLEVVFTDPEMFHKAVSELFGECSSKLLEDRIIELILKRPPTAEQEAEDFPTFIRRIKNGTVKLDL